MSFRKYIVPLVFCAQVASSFFDTALQMVVKERCANATDRDSEQKAITNFNMTFNMLLKFMPIVPAIILAKIGDKGYRKVPIAVPLVGYLVSRALLLLDVALGWPLQVLYAVPVIYGLCGGFASYWAGVMALVSVSSGEEDRSVRIMRTELVYGIAGFIGSLASGHLFNLYSVDLKQGVILSGLSVLLYLICMLYAIFVLRVEHASERLERRESFGILNQEARDKINIALLFASGILYDIAVAGGMEMLAAYVLKEPLNWGATEVGYGNAAGSLLFITSFVGVKMFTRCSVKDESMIMVGMVSFAVGIYFMAFVTTTPMYFLARSVTLFALIPMPTIRSLLSKQVKGSSYGITFVMLQLSFKLASLVTTPIYTKIYQATLDTFPGFVFILSSIFTVLSMIPISVVGCRSATHGYEIIQGN
ncbi:thymic stromal cotransporter homolog [Pimephales promelas]|uniref:thymic stromal cotransporter homolog n=1 Tax=Pimephales promelas TaxID=90988 RepID=UPI0019559614|nr:thymic stromal cotransporter homolog [Pimephales promelas]KAG1971005.1 solute carrier family [Pimephales promelas]